MLRKSARFLKVKAPVEAEAENKHSGLRSTLTSTSAYPHLLRPRMGKGAPGLGG